MITEPVYYIKIVAAWLVILTILVVLIDKEKYKNHSKLVFMLFVVPVMLSTLYLAGHTVHKNNLSITKGPVHWHADYEVWVCDQKLDLIDPKGFIGKVGTPLFHEHNDNRIHVEGSVNYVEDVTVANFFNVIGGELTSTSLSFQTNDEFVEVENGDLCNNNPGQLKVYVNGMSIDNIETYMYYPHPAVPPGDCVIVEFGVNLPETTDKLCNVWEVEEWNYENFKELRKEKHNLPVWRNPNWQYIDGEGMVEVGK